MTKKEMIKGLKAGKTLVVDRRDAECLPWLLDLVRKGKVEKRLVVYDEQSSALKFRWKKLGDMAK